MNLEQLKARAYDLVVLINNAQNELSQVNQAIQKEMEKPLPDPANKDAEPMNEAEKVKE